MKRSTILAVLALVVGLPSVALAGGFDCLKSSFGSLFPERVSR